MPDSLTLVVPVYNGGHFLRSSLEQAWNWLAAQRRPTELLVVDDGSTDTTQGVIDAFARAVAGREGPTFRALRHEPNRGKGAAVRRGLLEASGELVVFTDADLTYPIQNVGTIVTALEDGADLAYGDRMHPESRYVVAPTFFGYLFTRHAMGRVFNLLVRGFVVPGVMDTQAGLKGVKRAGAARLAVGRMNRFSFDVELLFLARRFGMRLASCPVRFVYRKEPSTVRFLRDALRMVRDMARIRYWGWRGVYDRPPPAIAPAAPPTARTDRERRGAI